MPIIWSSDFLLIAPFHIRVVFVATCVMCSDMVRESPTAFSAFVGSSFEDFGELERIVSTIASHGSLSEVFVPPCVPRNAE
jgi:hypothetical protein